MGGVGGKDLVRIQVDIRHSEGRVPFFPTLKAHKHTTEPYYRCWLSFRVGEALVRGRLTYDKNDTHSLSGKARTHTRNARTSAPKHVCGRQLPSQHNSPFDGGDIISPPVLDRIRSRGASFPPEGTRSLGYTVRRSTHNPW